MKTWSKNDITHDLVFRWFDKQLIRQSKNTIVSLAPRYNYIGNVLAFADHADSKELEVLERIVNVFTLPFDLTDKDVYVEWKEILFHNWLKAKGEDVFVMSTNGEVSYGVSDNLFVSLMCNKEK